MDVTDESIFAGLKVVDAATYIAGPAAATILADFGADVIKIESKTGDPYRDIATLPGMPVSSHNYCWIMDSRSKRSLAMDLKSDGGQEILHRLIADADVFITNFPFPVRRRLGLTYDALKALKPDLIYASLTAYGEQGPEADNTGFDSTAWWARTGLMDLVRTSEKNEPARSLPGMGDHPTATALYGAIVTALYRRERTGKGSYVHTSLMANGLWSNSAYVQAKLCGGEISYRTPREQGLNALTNTYCSSDGRWFLMALVQGDKHWPRFLQVLDAVELADDPRFRSDADRQKNVGALFQEIDRRFSTLDARTISRRMQDVGLTFGIVGRVDDVPQDPQMRESGAIIETTDPAADFTVASPIWVNGAAKKTPSAAPEIGADSDAILREAGFDHAAITTFREKGVIS